MSSPQSVPRVSRPSVRLRTGLVQFALLISLCLVAVNSARANDPIVVVSVTQLTFDAQARGTSSPPQRIVVSNKGTGDLIISSISIDGENGGDFTETHTCSAAPIAIAASAQCDIQVVFNPKSTGDSTAALSVTDNASGSPHVVALKGRSAPSAPVTTLSISTLAFGNQAIGTASKTQIVILKNTGSATLNVTSAIRIDGPNAGEFHVERVTGGCTEGTSQLAPGANCSIGVVFAPMTVGAKTAQVIVEDDAAGSPHAVVLNGTGAGS